MQKGLKIKDLTFGKVPMTTAASITGPAGRIIAGGGNRRRVGEYSSPAVNHLRKPNFANTTFYMPGLSAS